MTKLFEQLHIKEVSKKLFTVQRAGWVKRGVTNPETVGDHTNALVALAQKWAMDLEIEDVEDLQNLLAFHDWPEIIVGDILTYHLDGDRYHEAKQDKKLQEVRAIETLCKPLATDGEKVKEYWHRFENKNDSNARLANEIDKLQAVIQALEYEQAGQPVSAMEFVNEVRKRNQIHHPFLVKVLQDIEQAAKK